MSLSVNTNLASLAARRAMGAAEQGLGRTMARLASGLRVSSARDDAAGLAIAQRLTSRERGLQQAARNAGDGESLFRTVEGALGQMSEGLQHVRELLVQAANGSNSAADRASLNQEVRQALAEIDRVAAATEFNGRALLDGSYGAAEFQIGAGSADGLDVALTQSMRSAKLGVLSTAASADLRTLNDGSGGFPFAATYTTVPISTLDFSHPATPFSGGSARTTGASGTPATDYSGGGAAQITVDGISVTLNANYGSAGGVAAAIQAQLGAAGAGIDVTSPDGLGLRYTKTAQAAGATTAPSVQAVSGGNAQALADVAGTAGTAASAATQAGFSVDGHRVALVSDHSGDFAGLVADIQDQLDGQTPGAYRVSGSVAGLSITRNTGVAAPALRNFSGTGATVFASTPSTGLTLADGDLTVQVGSGPAVAVTGSFASADALAAGVRAQVGQGVTTSINPVSGALEIVSTDTLTLGGSAAQPGGLLSFASLTTEASGSLDDVNTRSADSARSGLLRIDAALDAVSSQRSLMGALQSRFEAAASSALAAADQATAARSRIADADMAGETASLMRQRVLQQAALAMVVQAQVQARDVLSLLG